LEKIDGGFGFLRLMADRGLVPEAVLREAGAKRSNPTGYLAAYGIADLAEVVSGVDAARVASMPGAEKDPREGRADPGFTRRRWGCRALSRVQHVAR
jgi:hypothetical protein